MTKAHKKNKVRADEEQVVKTCLQAGGRAQMSFASFVHDHIPHVGKAHDKEEQLGASKTLQALKQMELETEAEIERLQQSPNENTASFLLHDERALHYQREMMAGR